jgi:acyl-[acyl-carrier-protein] desaturase
VRPHGEIIAEIEEQRPRWAPGMLSHAERDRLIDRGLMALYRWYLDRSQSVRNWNPDRSFDWRRLRTDHSPDLNAVIEGFFAVEQYVPDYTSKLVAINRRSLARSHFQIRWGAEEERHAQLWRNAMLFTRFRSARWIEEYGGSLREGEWALPWDDPCRMAIYALFQERATQLNYLNMALIARGDSLRPEATGERDPVLEQVAIKIAADEAAHFSFFLEITRLHLYYYPAQTLESISDVIEHFAMPALDLLPDMNRFASALYRLGIYGPRQYTRDVLQVVLSNLGISSRRALEDDVRSCRDAHSHDEHEWDTSRFSALDYSAVETAVRHLCARVEAYEREIGLDEVDRTDLLPSSPASHARGS